MTTAREFLAAIPGENTNWRTSDVTPGEAKGMLETAVEGFKAQQDNITLPEDASRELQQAFNRYKTAVNVADGGDYIPSSPVTPGRVPGTFRMEKPSFNVRKAHAEKAAGLLQELLAMMKAESEAAFNKSQSALLEEG
jgi:hypothetical protein